ncbi:Pimeloyl-ACP methyl ester carboxylesterase [Pseudooceanicola antarcticus]|uniref:Alpha/beta hydrolase n=1 Tax=Pseudooceanicola antarcticus TaxID=1247613 RepID=A0A285ISS8_9RHOB|nr:alpha/beta hydrolase [Pseudooceanicola antarcticus]PJE31926.1 alpha/beta hydrolase [Pseudooceanicola antarcticus]SNY50873.1 Pimeloyl-ACP methyl ester carboxylesterase [Pseudooceanicola antarcticus]
MTDASRIATPQGRTLAYHLTEAAGERPTVVFLGGFNSDMGGTKAVFLEEWCAGQGLSFLRFDYSGHGESSEAFTDGCIGDWAEDAAFILSEVTSGPLILVGSSMGGWISLLMTRRMPERIAGLVTIAAAPDFTEDSMWAGFTEAQRLALEMVEQVALPSEYGEPYVITKRLIEDGRNHLLLRDPVPLPFPVRFLHGTADADVELSVALRLMERAEGADIHLRLVKGADHRFSTPECLALISGAIEEVLAAL